jgi:hypothetical protein
VCSQDIRLQQTAFPECGPALRADGRHEPLPLGAPPVGRVVGGLLEIGRADGAAADADDLDEIGLACHRTTSVPTDSHRRLAASSGASLNAVARIY